jgi:hypothetical protein
MRKRAARQIIGCAPSGKTTFGQLIGVGRRALVHACPN